MNKVLFILALGLLLIIITVIINFIKLICELLRPNYLKPESFFLMEDNSDFLVSTAENGVQATVRYADHIYAHQADERTNTVLL
jgi:hypothetical protein